MLSAFSKNVSGSSSSCPGVHAYPGRGHPPAHLQAIKRAAPSVGVQLQVVEARGPEDIDKAASAFRGRPQALIVLPSPLMYIQSPALAKLANKQRLPSISLFRRFAEAGGLIAYGSDSEESWERFAVLIAKILSGAKPSDLSIERPSKFELLVNLKTAEVLGAKIPESILVRADRIIR